MESTTEHRGYLIDITLHVRGPKDSPEWVSTVAISVKHEGRVQRFAVEPECDTPDDAKKRALRAAQQRIDDMLDGSA